MSGATLTFLSHGMPKSEERFLSPTRTSCGRGTIEPVRPVAQNDTRASSVDAQYCAARAGRLPHSKAACARTFLPARFWIAIAMSEPNERN